MITLETISIYNLFSGDIDSFARQATKSQREAISDEAFTLLEYYLSVIHIIEKNLASEAFKRNIIDQLENDTDSAAFDELTRRLKN